MLIIGAQIGRMDLSRLLGDRYALLVDVLRMLIFPTIMFIVVKLLHVEHDTAVTAFVLSALPSGSLNVVMAQGMEDVISFGLGEPGFSTPEHIGKAACEAPEKWRRKRGLNMILQRRSL